MKIIKQSRDNMKKSEIFKMTQDANIQKMSDNVGLRLDITDWVFYSDTNSKGEEHTILSIACESGVYATNSATFKEQFEKIVEMLEGEAVDAIEVVGGVSKNGRDYITCSYVGEK